MRQQMHVRIVPMNGDHLDEVAELERICFSTPWSRNMLAEELENDCAAFLVALDDQERVVGYAGLLVVLDEGYITNVAVRPECRRNGIAGKLLQVFLDFAQAHRLAFLTLEVRASNYGAIALYGSRGFRGVGRRKNYYEHPKEDAIIMTKEFTDGTEAVSYTHLNLQNIPTRTDLGSEIRRMFIPAEGCVLVDADYSQIELRLLAHMADVYKRQARKSSTSSSGISGVSASRVTSKALWQKGHRRSQPPVNLSLIHILGKASSSPAAGAIWTGPDSCPPPPMASPSAGS